MQTKSRRTPVRRILPDGKVHFGIQGDSIGGSCLCNRAAPNPAICKELRLEGPVKLATKPFVEGTFMRRRSAAAPGIYAGSASAGHIWRRVY